MKRFSIYKKSSKFYWSNDRIVYPIMIICILIILFRSQILKIETNSFDKFLSILLLVMFCIGIILQFFRIMKPDPLRGSLDGFITFDMESITAGNQIFNLNEIKKIEISNDDYYGKLKNASRGSFNSKMSNGVNNQIIIILNNGQKMIYNYELYNSNDLQKVKNELINYNLRDKLDFENLVNILGIRKNSEILEFRNDIQNRTAANSR